MRLRFSLRELSLALFALAALAGGAAADDQKPTPQGVEFFEKHIRPVLVKHCYECHAADSEEVGGELLLDTREGIRRGGETGHGVVPGNLKDSLVLSALEYRDLEMPPDGQLPDELIANFRRWIKMGAPDPRGAGGATAAGEPAAGGDGALWSLQPIAEAAPPTVNDAAWPRGDIDRFVLARLEARGLQPVADAPPLALLRRLYFDLTGLPPSPEEVERFAGGIAPEDYAELVDRLLSSPQFGERWGRHWLDVVRYAESAGSSRDVLMPHAWRYRDYVIDALNADLPFDRFLTEQVAGDLLPAETPAERDRLQVATGMLAIGQKSLNGGNVQMDIVDDQIDVVSRAFMGLTASCARCHDHKFDPIPTADYYALAGIFRSTSTLYGGGIRRPKSAAEKAKQYLVLGEGADERVRELDQANKQIAGLDKQRAATARKIQSQQRKLPKDWQANERELKEVAEDELSDADRKLGEQIAAFRAAQQELKEIQAQLAELRKQTAGVQLQYAVGVRESGKPDDCPLHKRGDPKNLGEKIERGFLSCVGVEDAPAIDSKQSGRLQLAAWLTHEDNPLTARVAANRIWQHLLGRGIVATVDNFGTTGMPPTHPGLLDYLARRLVAGGWSTKALIREIVLSRTYQLSSNFDADSYAADPENALYWRMSRRRLEAEPLRDAMLAVAGRLDLERPQASAVAEIGEGEVGRGINTAPLEKPFPHRSVYLPVIRGIVPEVLRLFDFPEPSNVQGLRDATNVPAQSLYLMNNPFVIENARALAERLLSDDGTDAEHIRRAFVLCYARPPTADESQRATNYLQLLETEAEGKDAKTQAWATWCHALIAASEFRYLD